MTTKWSNFQGGTITNNPLADNGTTLTSAELSSLPSVSSGVGEIMWLVLNPRSLNGLPPEIIKVTAHTTSSTSATVVRAQQGTVAQTYTSGTEWIVGVTQSDLEMFWSSENDGAGSGLDADLLDGEHASHFATRALVGTLQGNFLYVGTYDPHLWDESSPDLIANLPYPMFFTPENINLLTNSSYEWDEDSSGVADSWTAWTAATPTSTSRSIQTSGPETPGVKYQRCVATLDGSGEQFGVQQQVGSTSEQSVTAGESYYLSAYLKGTFPSTVRSVLRIDWYDSSGVLISSDTSNDTPAGSWSRVSTQKTAPANSYYVAIAIYAEYGSGSGGATTIDIDNVMFQQTGALNTYEPCPTESYRHGMQWLVSYIKDINLTITNRARASNIASIQTTTPHGLRPGMTVTILGVSDTSFNATVDVLDITNSVTFRYNNTGAEVASESSGGTVGAQQNAVTIGFLTGDPTGRVSIANGSATAANGDWLLANNPDFGTQGADVPLTINDISWVIVPAGAEPAVSTAMIDHISDESDPHSAAGYLVQSVTDGLYAQVVHYHTSEIESAIATHEADSNPHAGYLTPAEADAAYAALVHYHAGVYEPAGSVSAHMAAADPHTQYLTQGEADALYPPLSHSGRADHDGRYALLSQVPTVPLYVRSPDAGGTNALWLGGDDPNTSGYSASLVKGDMWVVSADIGLVVPSAPANLIATSSSGTSVELSWSAYDAGVAQDEVTVERETSPNAGTWVSPALLDDTTPAYATSHTDTGRTENTAYRYRVRAKNATGWGAYSYAQTTTANDAPSPPTSLTEGAKTAPSSTTCTIAMSWTAPSWSDPGASGARYEAYVNGAAVGYASGTSTSYTFTGLSENTSYTLGVKAVDAGGLKSTIATLASTSDNAAPPNVTGLTVTDQNYNEIKADWSAVTGISDLVGYRVRLYLTSGMVLQQTVTTSNVTRTFTGLSYSTGYTVTVEAYDAGPLYSATPASAADTTQAQPDVTPPGNVALVSFKPETSYGNMVLRCTAPADSDFDYYTVQRSTDGGSWTDDYSASSTPSASIVRTLGGGPYSAGQTVYVRVKTRDSNGNWNTPGSALSSYTLIASPTTIYATATANYQTNTGWTAGDRPAQSYYTDSADLNYGFFYYGTQPYDQLYYSGRRTITDSSRIWLSRSTWGTSSWLSPRICRHSHTTYRAGTSQNTGDYTTTLANSARNESVGGSDDDVWNYLPSGWAASLVAGTYKGIGTHEAVAAGHHWCNWNNLSEESGCGLIEFHHYG